MKKKIVLLTAVIMMFNSSFVVNAAPKTMEDGTVFDAEYYAEENPDVVAAMGRSEEALWVHYLNFGKSEGRKATADDNVINTVAPNRERSELAKSTKTEVNDAVARGDYYVLPFGAIKTSGTTKSGIYWESSWYRPYQAAWEYIYDANCGDEWDIEELQNGEILSELFNENIGKGGAELFLDFGYFVEYMDQFKARGIIPQDYQLPGSYYTITKTGGYYMSGVATKYYIVTDCPEAMAEYNKKLAYINKTNLPIQTYEKYTPKYLREQQK